MASHVESEQRELFQYNKTLPNHSYLVERAAMHALYCMSCNIHQCFNINLLSCELLSTEVAQKELDGCPRPILAGLVVELVVEGEGVDGDVLVVAAAVVRHHLLRPAEGEHGVAAAALALQTPAASLRTPDPEEWVVLGELLVGPLGHHHRQVERHLVPHDVHLNGG